jgi:hypothetical protein
MRRDATGWDGHQWIRDAQEYKNDGKDWANCLTKQQFDKVCKRGYYKVTQGQDGHLQFHSMDAKFYVNFWEDCYEKIQFSVGDQESGMSYNECEGQTWLEHESLKDYVFIITKLYPEWHEIKKRLKL